MVLRPLLDRCKHRRQCAPLVRQLIGMPPCPHMAALQDPLLHKQLQPISDDRSGRSVAALELLEPGDPGEALRQQVQGPTITEQG